MKIIAIVGKKKSGKTTLIEYLISSLKEYGTVGCIKHAHELDFDSPIARDTDRFFNAGAEVVIGSSGARMIKLGGGKELEELIEEMANSGIDFVLVEGFKSSTLPKIALNDFSNAAVRNILKRIDFSSSVGEELIEELVELILSLEDYRTSR
jgi:molybdopterin-guanine dinucleotide biosynthesis protein MobB